MKLQLKKLNVTSITLSVFDNETKREKNSFDLETSRFFSEEETNSFRIGFNLKIYDKSFDLFIEAISYFEMDDEITEEFKLSSFPKVNAPAIAFPYLRSFVSILTLQSGLDPVILPSINFVSLANSIGVEDN